MYRLEKTVSLTLLRKVVIPICEIFHTKKTQLFNYYSTTKDIIVELSLNNLKLFLIKFRRSVKQPL